MIYLPIELKPSLATLNDQLELYLKLNRKLVFISVTCLAETRNCIFGLGLGYAEIGCLAEISAETEIKDNFSVKIGYSAELFKLFGFF